MNPNNLQKRNSFKKHHGKTGAKHLQIQATVRQAQGWNSGITTLSQTSSLRTADALPVVASLPSLQFSEGEKRRPEMRLLFAG